MEISVLLEYEKSGLIKGQRHPILPLIIWNYTPKVQYESLWDEITIQTRGLVTDEEGNIFGRCFKKFWNLEEGKHTPTSEFDVYEKMDGSLIILFCFQGEWVVASRGSFTSDQSVSAKKIIDSLNTEFLSVGATYMFEYISPWNRIVVDYGDEEKLVLLGAIHTNNDVEAPYESLEYIAEKLGCEVVKKYDGIEDVSILKNMIDDTREGYVVRFSNGDRMKIKGDEYVRLHKIMTNISTTSIWEVLSNNESMGSYLHNVPDEFYKKIREYESYLLRRYDTIENHCRTIINNINHTSPKNRKEWAIAIKEQDKQLWPILFKMIDSIDYSRYVWKLIKPLFSKL